MEREDEVLRKGPAPIEQSDDRGKDRQQREQHARHRLEHSNPKRGWITDDRLEDDLGPPWRAIQLLQRFFAGFGRQLGPLARVVNDRDLEAGWQCCRPGATEIRHGNGAKKVEDAGDEIQPDRRDVPNTASFKSVDRELTRSTQEHAERANEAPVPPAQLLPRVADHLAHGGIRRDALAGRTRCRTLRSAAHRNSNASGREVCSRGAVY